MYFCGGSSGRGSCGQGSRIHRGLCERRGGRGCRASHGRGFGRGGGHGEKKASHDKSKTPAPIEWKPLENLFENQNCTKPYLEAMDVQRYAVNTQSTWIICFSFFLTNWSTKLFISQIFISNRFTRQSHKKKWRPIINEEIMAFLGINIGIVNLPEVSDCWSKGISQVPWFRSIMPGYRFEKICR